MLTQNADYSIDVSQSAYAKGMKQLTIPRWMKDAEKAPEKLISQAKGLLGASTWLSTRSRPDLSVLVSLGQQGLSGATIGDLRKLNVIVRRAKQWNDLKIHIPSIPLAKWALVSMSDSALGNASKNGSQAGELVTIMNKDVLDGKPSPWGALSWKSHRLKRTVGSSMAAESMALLNTLGSLEFALNICLEILFKDYDVAKREQWYPKLTTAHVLDAKSCYDHLKTNGPIGNLTDKRAALDLLQVKEAVKRLKTAIRWAPGSRQLSDVLTKDQGSAADTWRAHLLSQTYQLADEDVALEMRAKAKEARLARGKARKEAAEKANASTGTRQEMIPEALDAGGDDEVVSLRPKGRL